MRKLDKEDSLKEHKLIIITLRNIKRSLKKTVYKTNPATNVGHSQLRITSPIDEFIEFLIASLYASSIKHPGPQEKGI